MQSASSRTSGPSLVPTGWMLGVDWSVCDGRGWCVELLPELLVQDRWGYPLAQSGAERAAAARDGARGTGRPAREIPVPDDLVGGCRNSSDGRRGGAADSRDQEKS